MECMNTALDLDALPVAVETAPPGPPLEPSRRGSFVRLMRGFARMVRSGSEWLFGLASLVLGLSILAALPLAQLLSLGYFLESSARVAQTGRLRDGLIGVRRAARVGSLVLGAWLSMLPLWLVGSYAHSADLIDRGGPASRLLRFLLIVVTALSLFHILVAVARGGKLRHFLWPLG